MDEIPGPLVGPLGKALAGLRRKRFPGMSADEADAFELGFWAGAVALAIGSEDETISGDEIGDTIKGEEIAEQVATALYNEGRDPA